MTADDAQASGQAREVEVVARALVQHQRIPTFQRANDGVMPGQRCSGCDHLKDETDGSNSPRVVQHQVEVALSALAPIRAAERQEAARAALSEAASTVTEEMFGGRGDDVRLWLLAISRQQQRRADGVTGRSGT